MGTKPVSHVSMDGVENDYWLDGNRAPVDERGDNPDVAQRMNFAKNVFMQLQSGRPITEISREDLDSSTIAMGHLLHVAFEKRLISDPDLTIDDIVELVVEMDRDIRTYRTLTRHHLIRTMRDIGIIDADVPDRALKPAGTIPCVRTMSAVLEKATGYSFETIISPSRKAEVLQHRYRGIWVMRQCCGYSLTAIGRHFGGRDHTSILNAINQVEVGRYKELAVAVILERICETLDNLGVEKAYGRIRRGSNLRLVKGGAEPAAEPAPPPALAEAMDELGLVEEDAGAKAPPAPRGNTQADQNGICPGSPAA